MRRFDPVFLAGTTRSGTTLLSLMLNQHPAITTAGEAEWIFDYPGTYDPPLDAYREWVATNRHFLLHQLRIDPSLDLADLQASFLAQMRLSRDHATDITVWMAHRHYDRLLTLQPGARCIRMIRDGRDVCASWMKHGWVGNAWVGAQKWTALLAEWRAAAARLPSDRWISIRFEDLVRQPVPTLQRICDFLGVEYHPAMLEYPRHSTYGPVDPGQAEKWRAEMSPRQIRLFEAQARVELEAHGYAASAEKPARVTPLGALPLRLEHKVHTNLSRMQRFGFPLWLQDQLARRLGWRAHERRVRLKMHAITNAHLQ